MEFKDGNQQSRQRRIIATQTDQADNGGGYDRDDGDDKDNGDDFDRDYIKKYGMKIDLPFNTTFIRSVVFQLSFSNRCTLYKCTVRLRTSLTSSVAHMSRELYSNTWDWKMEVTLV